MDRLYALAFHLLLEAASCLLLRFILADSGR